jgi:gas vesicle protein
LLVGAGLGVLFAPRSGKQLRGELKERFEEGMPRAKEVIQSAVEQARSMNPRASAPHS